MAIDPLRLLVVFGSVRSDRRGIGLARLMVRHAEEARHIASLADPAEIELPLLDRMYKEYGVGEAPEAMERLADQIRATDGVIVVSAEYNHGIPPALKNLLDHYLEEWFHRPCGIVCYSAGRFGGVRAAMQLRMTLAELGMPTIPSLLPVPAVGATVDEAGNATADWIDGAARKFLGELTWWADAARAQRAKLGPPY